MQTDDLGQKGIIRRTQRDTTIAEDGIPKHLSTPYFGKGSLYTWYKYTALKCVVVYSEGINENLLTLTKSNPTYFRFLTTYEFPPFKSFLIIIR